MSGDAAKLAAMRDFVLASGSNLQTALLINDVMPEVRVKLVSDLVNRLSERLQESQPGWQVFDNSLATSPAQRYAILKWGPAQWREQGWGVGLSAERANARWMLFGLTAPSKRAPGRKNKPAMSDEDRQRL